MAQAHAAGREEAKAEVLGHDHYPDYHDYAAGRDAGLEEAAEKVTFWTNLFKASPGYATPGDLYCVIDSIRALRTASAQPTATEDR